METFRELISQKAGAFGLALFLALLVGAIFSLMFYEKYVGLWHNTTYWSIYPSAVPPTWFGKLFYPNKVVPTLFLKPQHVYVKNIYGGAAKNITMVYKLNYVYGGIPNDVKLLLRINYKTPPAVVIKFERPNGQALTLVQDSAQNIPSIISFNNFDEIKNNVYTWSRKSGIRVTQLLFTKGNETLKGAYTITISIIGIGNISASSELVVDGNVYGLMGTDIFGRDVFVYAMVGLPYGLMIGVLTSVIAALWGTAYGLVSGYVGGKVDEVMQRILEIWYSIPALPILIMLAILYKPTLMLIIVLIAIFSWMGTAKVVRSMVLSLKNEGYVLAAKAAGAPPLWIMVRHILPQILPYAAAQVALGVPGAILTEVSLDFLGLGDPNVPTWGWMLHDAQVYGASVNGYWWWILPPGIMVALVALSFAMIGYALDVVLNPRLKEV